MRPPRAGSRRSSPRRCRSASNTIYVASYHANNGHYSADINYFEGKGVDNPPLHALANGVSGGNGVYAYGSGQRLSQSDVECRQLLGGCGVPGEPAAADPDVLAVTPANPSMVSGASQQFTATGTYSDGSASNVTGQATGPPRSRGGDDQCRGSGDGGFRRRHDDSATLIGRLTNELR